MTQGETPARQWRSSPNCHSRRVPRQNEIPATLERQLGEVQSHRSSTSFRTRARTSGWKGNRVVPGSGRRPTNSEIQGSVPRHDPGNVYVRETLTQSGTIISRGSREVHFRHLRDSVEERNPMLFLCRPPKASAARVGGTISTGLLGTHDSAAAAVSCRGPFFSFPFPFDFVFATGA